MRNRRTHARLERAVPWRLGARRDGQEPIAQQDAQVLIVAGRVHSPVCNTGERKAVADGAKESGDGIGAPGRCPSHVRSGSTISDNTSHISSSRLTPVTSSMLAILGRERSWRRSVRHSVSSSQAGRPGNEPGRPRRPHLCQSALSALKRSSMTVPAHHAAPVPSHGLSVGTGSASTSLVLRVTRVRPCVMAVAANKESA